MKKLFVKALLISLLLLTVTALFACGGGHTHTPVTVKENETKTYCDAEGTYEEVTYCSECSVEITLADGELCRVLIRLYGSAIWRDSKAIEEHFRNLLGCEIVTAIN